MAAIVFLVLLAGHLLGDWVAQTDWQATNKTRSWAALAAQVASYHLIVGLLLLTRSCATAGRPVKRSSPLTVSAITHAVIDRRRPVRALLRAAGSPGSATVEWG
jgi:Protein of unknown function (DUF3307)